MPQEILAIIPARGGSKRVPKKNIKLLYGKPLIQYTIEATEHSIVDDVIVSTEDNEINDVAQKFGVRVIKRPPELATDWARTIDVILDVLRYENPDIIVCLQPTSPLRSTQDINGAINLFLHRNCESVISVCETGINHTWLLKLHKDYLMPVFGHKYCKEYNLPKMYFPNGAIYIARPQTLRKYKSFYTNKILPYIMPPERSIDIDNEIDFGIAEALIKQ